MYWFYWSKTWPSESWGSFFSFESSTCPMITNQPLELHDSNTPLYTCSIYACFENKKQHHRTSPKKQTNIHQTNLGFFKTLHLSWLFRPLNLGRLASNREVDWLTTQLVPKLKASSAKKQGRLKWVKFWRNGTVEGWWLDETKVDGLNGFFCGKFWIYFRGMRFCWWMWWWLIGVLWILGKIGLGTIYRIFFLQARWKATRKLTFWSYSVMFFFSYVSFPSSYFESNKSAAVSGVFRLKKNNDASGANRS